MFRCRYMLWWLLTIELLYHRDWWVVSAKEWLAQWQSLLPVFLTLRRVLRAPFVTQARVTFTGVQCVLADLAAATDTAASWLPTPHRVQKHRKSCCDLIVTIMLKGLCLCFQLLWYCRITLGLGHLSVVSDIISLFCRWLCKIHWLSASYNYRPVKGIVYNFYGTDPFHPHILI